MIREDVQDLRIVWRKNFGQTGANFLQGDATFDGTIGTDDFAVWRANFGFVRQPLGSSGSGVSLAAVPEPAAVWISLIALGWTTTLRRREIKQGFGWMTGH